MFITVLSVLACAFAGYLVIALSLIALGNILALALKYSPYLLVIGLVWFMVAKAKGHQAIASQDRAPQSMQQVDPRAELVKGARTWNF